MIKRSGSEFYSNYLKHKQSIFARFEREIFNKAEGENEQITCKKGCTYCCSLYVEAMSKECETVVYYLYQKEEALISFLEQYPSWREETAQLGDRCTKALNLYRNSGRREKDYRDLADAFLFYKLQNRACPFLRESTCLIYYARPFVCAAHFVSTPAEWCNPRNARQPKIYKCNFDEELVDQSYYDEQLNGTDLVLMPLKVHEILEKDLCKFTHIDRFLGLDRELIDQDKILSILKAYI